MRGSAPAPGMVRLSPRCNGFSARSGVIRLRWGTYPVMSPHRNSRLFIPDRGADGVPTRTQAVLLLNRAMVAMESMKAQWRRGLGLNTHERMALAQLWVNGPRPMSELGELIGLSRAAITTLVDGLEEQHYVVRDTDPLDRRRTIVRITDKPFDGVTGMADGFIGRIRAHVDGLTNEQWSAIARFLDEVHDVAYAEGGVLRATSDLDLRSAAGGLNSEPRSPPT